MHILRGVRWRNRVRVAAEDPSAWIGDRGLDGEHRRGRRGIVLRSGSASATAPKVGRVDPALPSGL